MLVVVGIFSLIISMTRTTNQITMDVSKLSSLVSQGLLRLSFYGSAAYPIFGLARIIVILAFVYCMCGCPCFHRRRQINIKGYHAKKRLLEEEQRPISSSESLPVLVDSPSPSPFKRTQLKEALSLHTQKLRFKIWLQKRICQTLSQARLTLCWILARLWSR